MVNSGQQRPIYVGAFVSTFLTELRQCLIPKFLKKDYQGSISETNISEGAYLLTHPTRIFSTTTNKRNHSKGFVCREIMGGTQARHEGPKPATPGLGVGLDEF